LLRDVLAKASCRWVDEALRGLYAKGTFRVNVSPEIREKTMSTNSQAKRGFPRVKIGVSSCLLGQEVRYNGGHKQDRFLVSSLSRFVDYVPVCPEVAIGLGIPRPPIRLVGAPDRPKAVCTDDPTMDVTNALQSFAQDKVPSLGDISGYILTRRSRNQTGLIDYRLE
jgi:hypothetical protein